MINLNKFLNILNTFFKREKFRFVWLVCVVFSLCSKAQESDQPKTVLTLQAAIEKAQLNDPWLVGNLHSQNAVESNRIAAGTLPDPKMSVTLANLPTDSFDFNQEGMTQFKFGVQQKFPQGDTLKLKQKQLRQIGGQFPYQRQDRKARIAVEVSLLWLELFKVNKSIELIEKSRTLFEQLADVAEASYSSAVGRTRQQDIVRAQLELIRLEDRLTQLRQNKETLWKKLSEWLSDAFVDEYLTESLENNRKFNIELMQIALSPPALELNHSPMIEARGKQFQRQLTQILSAHPSILALEQKIQATAIEVDIAKQKYKPAWELNASYGYRDNDLSGAERSDLFSVGVSFELPLFTNNRQDKQVEAAVSKTSAVKTEKWQQLRKMLASFESARSQWLRLNQRQTLYQNQLLPQMHQQAEASLTAYTNDDGDFAEVVRARIAELNAEIDALAIHTEKQKTIVKMNYFLVNSKVANLNSQQNLLTTHRGEKR